MNDRFKLFLYRLLPIALFLSAWQYMLANNKKLIFYFGLPSQVGHYLVAKTLDGSLVADFFATLIEAVVGFIIGNLLGTAIGLCLWFSNRAFIISKPYIIALGSAPIFALSPIMIIWFGTGIFSKIMIATLSTVFIALLQAYTGATQVDPNHLQLLRTMNAPKKEVFNKVIAPSSIVWVTSAFKLNIGFALLGAFIGEYISSEKGLGHLILVASGLFDISLVLTGVLLLIFIALSLNYIVGLLEVPVKKLIVRYL